MLDPRTLRAPSNGGGILSHGCHRNGRHLCSHFVGMASALCLLTSALHSYLPGDPVPMMRRTQQKGRRSAWHEVPHRISPRFLTDHDSILDVALTDVADEPLKVALALHGLDFVTTWITVADGKGKFLSHLELLLTASGDALTGVRWETEYVDDEPPAHVSVHTAWNHEADADLDSALNALFYISALITILLVYFVCRDHYAAFAELLGDEEHDEALDEQQRALGTQQRGHDRSRQRVRGEILREASGGYYGSDRKRD